MCRGAAKNLWSQDKIPRRATPAQRAALDRKVCLAAWESGESRKWRRWLRVYHTIYIYIYTLRYVWRIHSYIIDINISLWSCWFLTALSRRLYVMNAPTSFEEGFPLKRMIMVFVWATVKIFEDPSSKKGLKFVPHMHKVAVHLRYLRF